MKKIVSLSIAFFYFTQIHAQTKEVVYRVDGSNVTNSSGSSFHPAVYIFQDASNSTVRQNESGNFNPRGDIFYVYPSAQIDVMIKAKDDQITALQKELTDLKATLTLVKADVRKLKIAVNSK